jgi:hypothetical protein
LPLCLLEARDRFRYQVFDNEFGDERTRTMQLQRFGPDFAGYMRCRPAELRNAIGLRDQELQHGLQIPLANALTPETFHDPLQFRMLSDQG